ncbi:MAG: hypothetical protein ACREQI_11540 [Candidatus Binataceae bacterium]
MKHQRPDTCEVQVTFTPTGTGAYTGALKIIDNLEPSFEQIVPLKGEGRVPK